MKRISILIAFIIVANLNVCIAQNTKVTLKTDLDSISYALGMARSSGLKGYLAHSGIDTTYMDDFMKGFKESVCKTSAKDLAYISGMQIGQMVGNNWVEDLNRQIFKEDSILSINKSNMIAGFIAGVMNDATTMSLPFALNYSETAVERVGEKVVAEQYSDNKTAGEKFLAKNKSKKGVKTTKSGLQYREIVKGNGEIPTAHSVVKVNYKGTFVDGTEFDSSYKHGEPTTFRANQVIKGWTEALTLMPVGSKWEIYIPQNLAYGSRRQGPIPPFSALIFEIELISIEDAVEVVGYNED